MGLIGATLYVCLYHTSDGSSMRKSKDTVTPYFPRFYEGFEVECRCQLKEENPADCVNNQPDVINHNALAHVEADQLSLCRNALGKARRTMGKYAENRRTATGSYRQPWAEYNLSQTREKALFQDFLYQLCQALEEPVRRGAGRPSIKLSDLIFAACVKVYEGFSGRRNQTDLREALARGYLSRNVHYNTIFKYLDTESLTPYLHELITQSSLPLKTVEVDFAVDSSGFSTCQYVRWFDVNTATRRTGRIGSSCT